MKVRRATVRSAILPLLLLPILAGAGPAAADECTRQAVALERSKNLPPGLLHAMTLAESGFDGRPHPLALSISGRSHYPKTRAEAARLLRDKDGQLRRNVTAGCMQLSLTHHGHRFDPPERILDAAGNMSWAAEYLMRLKAATGSWAGALARYQGGSQEQRRAYVCRIWNHLRVLAPASAILIEARTCFGLPLPQVAPETVQLAHDLRRAPPPPPVPGRQRPVRDGTAARPGS